MQNPEETIKYEPPEWITAEDMLHYAKRNLERFSKLYLICTVAVLLLYFVALNVGVDNAFKLAVTVGAVFMTATTGVLNGLLGNDIVARVIQVFIIIVLMELLSLAMPPDYAALLVFLALKFIEACHLASLWRLNRTLKQKLLS